MSANVTGTWEEEVITVLRLVLDETRAIRSGQSDGTADISSDIRQVVGLLQEENSGSSGTAEPPDGWYGRTEQYMGFSAFSLAICMGLLVFLIFSQNLRR